MLYSAQDDDAFLQHQLKLDKAQDESTKSKAARIINLMEHAKNIGDEQEISYASAIEAAGQVLLVATRRGKFRLRPELAVRDRQGLKCLEIEVEEAVKSRQLLKVV